MGEVEWVIFTHANQAAEKAIAKTASSCNTVLPCCPLSHLLLLLLQVSLQAGTDKVLGCIDIRLPQTATGMRVLGELLGSSSSSSNTQRRQQQQRCFVLLLELHCCACCVHMCHRQQHACTNNSASYFPAATAAAASSNTTQHQHQQSAAAGSRSHSLGKSSCFSKSHKLWLFK
jgi:hypothetical protein